jgi:hypothetical protein
MIALPPWFPASQTEARLPHFKSLDQHTLRPVPRRQIIAIPPFTCSVWPVM